MIGNLKYDEIQCVLKFLSERDRWALRHSSSYLLKEISPYFSNFKIQLDPNKKLHAFINDFDWLKNTQLSVHLTLITDKTLDPELKYALELLWIFSKECWHKIVGLTVLRGTTPHHLSRILPELRILQDIKICLNGPKETWVGAKTVLIETPRSRHIQKFIEGDITVREMSEHTQPNLEMKKLCSLLEEVIWNNSWHLLNLETSEPLFSLFVSNLEQKDFPHTECVTRHSCRWSGKPPRVKHIILRPVNKSLRGLVNDDEVDF